MTRCQSESERTPGIRRGGWLLVGTLALAGLLGACRGTVKGPRNAIPSVAGDRDVGDGASSGGGDQVLPFGIPIWSPEARWDPAGERYVGIGVTGFLDGSAPEVGWSGDGPADGELAYGAINGPYGLTAHDPENELYFLVAGAARGYLDGPFSRARLGGGDYSHRSRQARSVDGRYLFFTEPFFNGVLRRADLVAQEIQTMPVTAPGILGLCGAPGAQLIVVYAGSGKLVVVDNDGTQVSELMLELQEALNGGVFPLLLALDELHQRLYASYMAAANWYIWYWQLTDGSFHGVLPKPQSGEVTRARNECGPFDGTDLYGEMRRIVFGPEDPDLNYLYVTPNDTQTFFRLDLRNRWVWGGSNEPGGIRFIDTGVPKNFDWDTRLTSTGDIIANVPFWNGARLVRYRRSQ